jgi:hypothetical protein
MTYERLFNRLGVLALFVALVVVAGVAGWHTLLNTYAGAWVHQPEDADWLLPDAARQLIADSLVDIDGSVVDHRIAVLPGNRIGRGPAGEAAQPSVDELQTFDIHASRLLRQIGAVPADYRGYVFAQDAAYTPGGELDEKATAGFVANADVVALAERSDGQLLPVISVHPARADAASALARWADAGIRDVAWWPIAQQIDLTGAPAKAAYTVMASQGMRLHTRVGHWRDNYGRAGVIDPDALRAALEAGVDVTVSIGDVSNVDAPDVMQRLFALLRVPEYRDRLSIALDGVLSGRRVETVLTPLLQHPQFFERLRYASGYPHSAVARAIDLDRLANSDFIDPAVIEPLRALYDVNPLLFVFVTMRQIHLPTTGLTLPASVFERRSRS